MNWQIGEELSDFNFYNLKRNDEEYVADACRNVLNNKES